MSTSTAQAKHQGAAAASIAVAQAKRLGILPGNPIYYDMEGYVTGGSNTPAVMAFLAGWTFRLHNDGYISGVYSSASSGIKDLVTRYHSKYPEPNDIPSRIGTAKRTATIRTSPPASGHSINACTNTSETKKRATGA